MPDLAARAVGPDQVRERRFQLGIAADQRVVFRVGDLGIVVLVIRGIRGCDQPVQAVELSSRPS
mgnify:CR=1 FL=1